MSNDPGDAAAEHDPAVSETPIQYRLRADRGIDAVHPDGIPPTITLAAGTHLAMLFQSDSSRPDDGVIHAHGESECVNRAWRAMWPTLMRSPSPRGGRLANDFVLETFPVTGMTEAMMDAINATLSGQASPVTLRARLVELGLRET